MTDDVTEGLARELADADGCTDGEDKTLVLPQHRVAARAILAGPTVRELLAGAWDEGYESGNEYGHDLESHWARGIGSFDTEEPKNPYREAGE